MVLPGVFLPRFFDLDGDGDLDLVGVSSRRRLYRRAGTTFTEIWSEPTAYNCATGVAFGDVNGDGLPGLFFADCDGPSAGYSGRTRFYEQTASGVSTGVTWQTGTAWNTGVAAADFDRDGDTDVFVINQGGMPPAPTRSSMHIAAGGTLGVSPAWAVTHPVRNADFANVNVDPRLELLTCGVDACGSGGCGGAEPARIYLLSSGGVGTQVWTSDGVDQECHFGDFDGDGDQDVFAFSRTATRGLSLYLNALGTLASSPALRIAGVAATNGESMAVGDIDRDGRTDVAISTGAEVRVYLSRNATGTPSFSLVGTFAGNSINQITDVNGDGYADVVYSDGSGLRVLEAGCVP